MVVKIKKKASIMGKEAQITHYLPEDTLLTREKRKQAENLDSEILKMVGDINDKYEKLDKSVKKNELEKWKWLGREIDNIFKKSKHISPVDIDNNCIWPAIGQYLRGELYKGFNTKRSGTKKDHYRKCWLLAKTPSIEWISNWGGWDAFVDRGDPLVTSNKIIPIIGKKFANIKLKSKDYQVIAKMITKRIPLRTDKPKDIDALSSQEIEILVEEVYRKFIKK